MGSNSKEMDYKGGVQKKTWDDVMRRSGMDFMVI
jgi:hypothetical protein